MIATERLLLRRFSLDDAPFVFGLVNQPSFLRFIGDRGVRTLDDARTYLANGPLAMYARHGLGLLCVELRSSSEPIGMCGLLKRETLDDVDLGFAFLPQHWAKGYAVEAALAVLEHGTRDLGLQRIVAITSPDNHASMRVLEKTGFTFERLMRLTPEDNEVQLFARSAAA
jgi:RimJ/RimL family protein N-acetyltransferase